MKIKYILTVLLAITVISSCDEEVLEQQNPNEIITEKYFINEGRLNSATNGIYAILLGNNLWGRMAQYFEDCRDDEHRAGGGQLEGNNNQLLEGTYTEGNGTINPVWRGLYRTIHRSNAVIQYGPGIPDINQTVLNQRLGEAKFFRSWAYYMLVAHWGKVPVYTQVVSSATDFRGPSEESEIYSLIETDLKDILTNNALPAKYTNAADNGRVTKGAVQLLLARVLMHQGKYDQAKTVLLDVFNSGTYRLMDEYHDNFRAETEYNDESIFEVSFSGHDYGWSDENNSTTNRGTIMFQDYNPTGWRNIVPSNKLLNEYERPYLGDPKEDPRMRETIIFTGDTYGDPLSPKVLADGEQNGNSSTYNGITIKTGFYKYSPMYKLAPGSWYVSDINYRHMRFAEVIFKLAECENEVGTTAQAIYYLNLLRDRPSVKMEHYPTTRYPCSNKDEIYKAIMHEGMVEFSNEHIRTLDLARWRKNGKFNATNPEPIEYIKTSPDKGLLIYPDSETSVNTKMQNL